MARKCIVCAERPAESALAYWCGRCVMASRRPRMLPLESWAARRARAFERKRSARHLAEMRRTIALQGIALAAAKVSFTDCSGKLRKERAK